MKFVTYERACMSGPKGIGDSGRAQVCPNIGIEHGAMSFYNILLSTQEWNTLPGSACHSSLQQTRIYLV